MEQTVNVNEVSRISTGTVIKGEINSPNDIRIDGSFEGKIVSNGRVVVGDKAVISGDVICDNVDFWGRMATARCWPTASSKSLPAMPPPRRVPFRSSPWSAPLSKPAQSPFLEEFLSRTETFAEVFRI